MIWSDSRKRSRLWGGTPYGFATVSETWSNVLRCIQKATGKWKLAVAGVAAGTVLITIVLTVGVIYLFSAIKDATLFASTLFLLNCTITPLAWAQRKLAKLLRFNRRRRLLCRSPGRAPQSRNEPVDDHRAHREAVSGGKDRSCWPQSWQRPHEPGPRPSPKRISCSRASPSRDTRVTVATISEHFRWNHHRTYRLVQSYKAHRSVLFWANLWREGDMIGKELEPRDTGFFAERSLGSGPHWGMFRSRRVWGTIAEIIVAAEEQQLVSLAETWGRTSHEFLDAKPQRSAKPIREANGQLRRVVSLNNLDLATRDDIEFAVETIQGCAS